MNLNSPLFRAIFNNSVAKIILEANAPDFSIVDYNEEFEKTSYTTSRNVRGLKIIEAYPTEENNQESKILINGLISAVETKEIICLPAFQYNVPSADLKSTKVSWWQSEILPVIDNGNVQYLLVTVHNITDKVLGTNALGESIERENRLNIALADTHEELAASNEELQANLEDLISTNEELTLSRKELQLLNDQLELRIEKRTEDLQSSRLLLQNIIQTTNVAMTLLKGKDLIIEHPNPPMIKIWQRKPENVVGKRITDVFPELETQRFPKLLAEVFESGKSIAMPEVPVNISYENSEMGLIYVDFSYDPIFDKDGNVEYILATVNDITDNVLNRKRLEANESELQATTEELAASNEELSATNEELATTNEELQEAQETLFLKNEELLETEESLRLALASGNLGIYSIEPETGKFDISPKAREFYGLPISGKITWVDVTNTVVPEYLPVIEEARSKALLTKQPFDVQYPILQSTTNKIKWVRVVGKSIPKSNSRVARFLGVILDITAETEYRHAIEESESRFRNMAEATDVFIAVGDGTNNATYFNTAWTALTGRSMNDLLKFGWADLIHPEDRDRYVEIYLEAFKNKSPFTGEFRILDKDGNYSWLLAKGNPRFNKNGEFAGYISSSVDISELKKDEIRKNDFIGMVSHELKTPLTAISGFVQVLQSRAKKNEDSYALIALNRTYNQVKKMTVMINGFLNVSRLESGKLLIEKSDFQLDELIKELVEESDLVQFSHKINLSVVQPIIVNADRDKIGSVISNLLSNAVKYSPSGTEIDIRCEILADKAVVSITDEGIGIDEEDVDKLFNRYYRVGKHHTISGFGIGLYLSSEIIERHNGKIGVNSEIGKGSTFYFEIPLV
ncbi:PAS domain S-box protein [Pedobacter aquatilis]|uniref:PAS domain S-box protein n=1 Tax=Pedobacter aquatilis TaxID=351343 RepID=UPI0025B37379|nr:PAS domain S-box protein [Pedobacter aquatilis]MDN3588859.1 PAS domain S-box protein [Pedobacter aquatilis]